MVHHYIIHYIVHDIKQKKDGILKLMAETETGSGTSSKSIHEPNKIKQSI